MATKPSDAHSQLAIHRELNVERDEYLDYMTFRANKRPLFLEIFGPIIGLKEEWAAQGATPEELDLSAFHFLRPKIAGVAASTRWMGGEPERVEEETDEHIITVDTRGRRMKLIKGYASIPLPLDYPVKTMDDWLKIKHHYEFSEERFGKDWAERARQARDNGFALRVSIPGGFDEPRQLMGEEMACMACFTDPELMHDILGTIGDTAYRVFERVVEEVQVDELFVHEDMAGKSGPLMGPAQIEEFVKPYYRKAWDLLEAHGARVFGQDSDGDMNAVIDAFLDAGLNFMYPMEPAANMDIVKLREKYGTRLAFMGGIDKHVLRRTKEEIEAELEYKIPPMVRTGGCILGLDHRITDGTPIENYRFYVEKAWEIMNREMRR